MLHAFPFMWCRLGIRMKKVASPNDTRQPKTAPLNTPNVIYAVCYVRQVPELQLLVRTHVADPVLACVTLLLCYA
jgi:hypothetical protein